MDKEKSPDNPVKTNFLIRFSGLHSTIMLLILIFCTIILIVSGIIFYKNYTNTKLELQHCKSSCENYSIL